MNTRAVAAVAVALALVVTAGVPAQAATPVTIADWRMNEGSGASTMVDAADDHDGRVGDEVVTGVVVSGTNRAYRFAKLKPNTPPAHPEHNVVVPHAAALNPGSRAEYAVEVRYRTTNSFGNIVQKGQAGGRFGYWKIQLPQGEPSCLFRGPGGVTNAVRATNRVDDGKWHTVRCVATPTEAQLWVDGVLIGRNRGTTGQIANTEPVYIGGKGVCDQVKVTCDYFGGDIDYVRIEGSW